MAEKVEEEIIHADGIQYPSVRCQAIGHLLEVNAYPRWLLRNLVSSTPNEAELLDVLQFLIRHWQTRTI